MLIISRVMAVIARLTLPFPGVPSNTVFVPWRTNNGDSEACNVWRQGICSAHDKNDRMAV
jgi:hypothetical protein